MKNTVFLDIDGVIQPGGWQKRFKINRTELQEQLTQTLKEDYKSIDQYDVAAVYCDWDKEALEFLKKILIQFEARIIISSSWRRSHPLKQLRMLFKIHDLDTFVEGAIPMPDTERPERIQEFIDQDPNMGKFVIFDDDCYSLRKHFPNQLVCCPNRLGIEQYQQALHIFES
jgi:HAD domain in Swiss Army Knife RNA repair proteins